MSEHIVPKKTYYAVFGALMALTAITVFVARFDLPWILNIVVALTIAVTKATLVVLYFMHVRYSSRLTQVVVVAGIFWLVIMLVLTASDYVTRGLLAPVVSISAQ
ncbi:cytochrome C oxidase subunit IV family protein [Pyrinomonas methylaliphatogenes]|jgi:cytochrome c oxidase subunit 4|uniref:Caa(3)-type oxidase, subunit IV n=1 Tax=Pyrinomonas methylaliphatogenes TaxID=454194 RepID=A0A0B6X2C6_9BACT|nr:cytochrome C oxidase subunit IV family protein [Pyrinomonas methylaliphatogenes]MBX5479755.1 cytochrome C oxidase subunit IV family protein [Pyrinomonas methylaliphatogenes]CDM66510.1 caa(3)-type oxidase, subunit IV [Pyrinomonas methylaliphatogenes]